MVSKMDLSWDTRAWKDLSVRLASLSPQASTVRAGSIHAAGHIKS
jgi:hypothetical protein